MLSGYYEREKHQGAQFKLAGGGWACLVLEVLFEEITI